ncbi:MAG: Na+/H+ antiporter subunit E [Gammaproteobacteria bacterium]
MFAALWIGLSGHFEPLLLALGAVAVTLVVWIELRIEKATGEALPHGIKVVRLPAYLSWLGVEVVKANIDVARRIVGRPLDISPTVVDVPCSQHSDLARVLFANSITLTPGTVSMRVDERLIQVHALTREAAAEVLAGEMDRRVSRLEGLQ